MAMKTASIDTEVGGMQDQVDKEDVA